jgi:Ca-activated chloride channel family protein
MAAHGHGLCTFITEADEAENGIDAFFARLDRPVMTDLKLEWAGAEPLDVYPSRLPDLHAGEPLLVSARLAPFASLRRVTLHGRVPDGPLVLEQEVEANTSESSGVGTRWARARVTALMDELAAGAPGSDESALRDEVVLVSKAFQIVTRFTSLVAVEEFPTAVDESRPARVANALPAGSRMLLPQGGTSGPLLRLAGMLLLAMGALLLVRISHQAVRSAE